MKLNIEKIANVIIYMLDEKVAHLNDKKLSILLFLIDYEYYQKYNKKIFGDVYVKYARNPEPKLLTEIFEIIANDEDLDELDERLYLISELLEFLDIDIISQDNFIELKFIKLDEDFDEKVFEKPEFQIIKEIVAKYKNTTSRNVANDTFKIELVRTTNKGETII